MSPNRDLLLNTGLLRPLTDTSFILNVHVQPKASANRIAGLHADALKICITAPPVDGKANKAIISFLAQFFSLPKSSIHIDGGQHSRSKRVRVSGLSPNEAREKLSEILARRD